MTGGFTRNVNDMEIIQSKGKVPWEYEKALKKWISKTDDKLPVRKISQREDICF